MNKYSDKALSLSQTSPYLADYIDQSRPLAKIDFFDYAVQFGDTVAPPFNAGQTLVRNLRFNSDSDFALQYMTFANYSAAAFASTTDDVGRTTIQITEMGSGKTFYREPALLSCVAGSTGFPLFLMAPRILKANSEIRVELLNNFGNNVIIEVSFLGSRIFYGD
jgi:hypothetical protein